MANDEQPWEVEADDSPPAPCVVLEACCDSRESVRNAVKGGASRVEICARSSLHVGGLTPSPTLVRAALAEAADGLVDMYNAERIDLEDVLTISAWPAFARNRFLQAWQALRSAGRAAAFAADEGTAELVLPAGPGNPPTFATRATAEG